ncbi:probable E3 ubiquitin-protein ligase RHC1A [Tanacetum coccineum]
MSQHAGAGGDASGKKIVLKCCNSGCDYFDIGIRRLPSLHGGVCTRCHQGLLRTREEAHASLYPHDRTKCPICLEKIRTGDDLKELPCKHAFHTDCIAPWFQSSNTCPYCRGKLPVADGSSGSRGTPPSRSADGSRGISSYRVSGVRYGVYTQRSLNTVTQIVVKGILVADELQ